MTRRNMRLKARRAAPAPKRELWFGFIVLLFLGSVALGAPPATDSASEPIIVHLKNRRHEITIRSGKTGPLYSIRSTQNGKVLANQMTDDELKAKDPELYELVKTMVATLDASVSRDYVSPSKKSF